MMNRAVMTMLVVAALGGGAILFFWQRTPYTAEKRVTLAGSTTTAIVANGPKIHFDRMEIDLGETLPLAAYKGVFHISNTGKAVLELKPPQPDCGCTVTTLAKTSLQPGEQVELPFMLSLAGAWSGGFEKLIHVLSNDPVNPTQMLKIRGVIKPFVELEPSSFVLGNVHYRDSTNLNVAVRRLDGQPLNITNVMHSANCETKYEPAAGGNGSEWKIDIKIKSAGKPSFFGESIALYSDDQHVAQPVGLVNLNGRWADDLIATPEQLHWSIPTGAKWSEPSPWQVRTLVLTSLRPDQPFKILGIKTNLDGLQVSIKPRENDAVAEIAIRLVKPLAKYEKGSVVIDTDHPALPKIEVPFQIFVPQ
jgi:hypothetical protein